jgi:hypothetical protein
MPEPYLVLEAACDADEEQCLGPKRRAGPFRDDSLTHLGEHDPPGQAWQEALLETRSTFEHVGRAADDELGPHCRVLREKRRQDYDHGASLRIRPPHG